MTVGGSTQRRRLTQDELSRTDVRVHEFVLNKDSSALDLQFVNVCRLIELHPLTLEDCRKGNQRPKFEVFPEYFFLVIHHFQRQTAETCELHIVIQRELIVIIADKLAPGEQKWSSYMNITAEQSLAQIIHNVFDSCIDGAEQQAAGIADAISDAEYLIIENKFSQAQILELKRNALKFQRVVNATLPLLKEVMNMSDLTTENELVLRNILDHQERLRHDTDSIQTELIALFDVYWGAADAVVNEQIKRLTILATTLVPLAFWTGFFGMNFKAIPFESSWFFILALVLMSGSVLGVFFFLRRRGIVGQRRFTVDKPVHQHSV
jgi:magnesium transporter